MEVCMLETGKQGSSRRKGDEYQDFTALRIILDNYIARKPFEIFLEYEGVGNLDDIVLFQETAIIACQVKYAVNPLAIYEAKDFIDTESPVSLKKFADSWKIMRARFPAHQLTVSLYSNRGLDAALLELIASDGKFSPEVITNRKRGKAKELRSQLLSASGLDDIEFSHFLADFKFELKLPVLSDMKQHIQTVLINKELGLSDNTIFLDLADAIKNNAMFSREAITVKFIDELLEHLQSKLLIPQVFPVNQNHFVEQKSLSAQLNRALPQINGGYLIVTGLPGSGKSTSLTTYFDSLSRSTYEVFKYYCFVGVNDNAQSMRVQAESLRANLLNEFHRRYPSVLKRRFDYSEHNFIESLITLAQYFVEQGRRFIILLDGLDHAERLESEVRNSVIDALPSNIPQGVTIVVGTQELHSWPHFLKRVRECPDSHIKMPLFSEVETQDYLENKRGISELSHANIMELHKKSEGLPLYLRYAAEILISSESLTNAITSLSPASEGDIRNYYELLWNEFDRVGMGNARHLCMAMACLQFSVHRDELYKIVDINRPNFEDAYKCINHLLRNTDGKLTVFHNSFREFVANQGSADWKKEINHNICSFLKTEKTSSRWFAHVFKYCFEVEDYKYISDEVNSDFIDSALLHYRPSAEIIETISLALESAFKQKDIIQLSRLGSLKFRTSERLERNLNRALLADALLAMGREQDVISFAFSPEANHWLVDNYIALAIMTRMAEEGKFELGDKLFNIFINEFHGISSDNRGELKPQVVGIARCLGIYAKTQARPLRWLSQFNLTPDSLEQRDVYAPGYAPHLATYIDALVQFQHTGKWQRLKREKKLFKNNLVRYLLIRALASHNHLDELKIAVYEYWEQEKSGDNVELAFYAAMAGISVSDVLNIAGTIEAPITESPDFLPAHDQKFMHYVYSFVIMAYEGNNDSYASLIEIVGNTKTLWNSALRHLLKACHCIGLSFSSAKNDWYDEACDSITILIHAQQGDAERICDSIDHIRKILPLTIGLLTEQIHRYFPSRLDKWIEHLAALRDSLLWNTHFGISESRQDYIFELELWQTLTKHPHVRIRLAPILNSCSVTYQASTMLKGGSRSEHFMRLSAIMAKCGMRNEAMTWLHYGIKASLIYGYHKDVTLLYLIDILKQINQISPQTALARCARILSMVKWMPHLTDNRETKWFTEMVFESVLDVNKRAALDLLKHFSSNTSRWKMQNCMEKYLLATTDGDPEYLWCFSELFSNHDSDDGAYCNQIIKVKQHIVNLASKSCSEEILRNFERRLKHFILTEITPRHWPEQLKNEFNFPVNDNESNSKGVSLTSNLSSMFVLDGKSITKEEIIEKCRTSFTDFLSLIEKLKKQNNNFYEPFIIDELLQHYIAIATSATHLIQIKKYIETQGRWQNANVLAYLAERFMELGSQEDSIQCFGLAYACFNDWRRWQSNAKYLAAIATKNKEAAQEFLIKECYESTSGSGNGYDTPPIATSGLEVLHEHQILESAFNDFLVHCESMFAQLPKDNMYSWLKEYQEPVAYANEIVLNIIIDNLSTPEIDYGERLIKAIARLVIVRPECISILISRIESAQGRLLRRLLTIFYCTATLYPSILKPYHQELGKLLDREDFFIRQSVLHILRCIGNLFPLDDSVINSVKRIERIYSNIINYSSYRMTANVTPGFVTFLKKSTLFDFSRQITVIENILQVPAQSIFASIEKQLIAQKWSIDDEITRLKDNWDGYVHPQGWPVIWIETDFQEFVTNILGCILNEVAEKLKLSNEQRILLWQTIQPADTQYVFHETSPRPSDIMPLCILDKQAWFNELAKYDAMKIVNTKHQMATEDWITIFERRKMAQDEKYNVPYKQIIFLRAFLIPPLVYRGTHDLDQLEKYIERINYKNSIPFTIEQAQNALTERMYNLLDQGKDAFPLIAEHQNPLTFLGYQNICTPTSFIIRECNLSFDGMTLCRDGKVVAQYEVWQEGHQDEVYSRDKLSFGVRLRVHRTLLEEICKRHRRILCIYIDETREYCKSIYNKLPDEQCDSARYILYHL